jgi:aspartyl-tRNA(Asn)/glutamyl-tRNA(Gln) amidotransferase subunit A
VTTELHELGAREAAERIARRELSPVDLLEHLIRRLDELEPQIRAWVTVDRSRALAAAKELEVDARHGRIRGALHGVPIGLKDIYSTAGLRTTCGSPIFAEYVPSSDATVVRRLKQAGALILGKTVTTEFAGADPGPTRNPWNVEHTPGGSSSGSAAAVAARTVPLAFGSQTGGSIQRPAAFCGVFGLKPTTGRVSKHGVFPVSWSLDHMGPLARSVADIALALQISAGHDPHDPSTSSAPVPDFLSAVEHAERPPRIGLVRDYYMEHADAELREHTEGVATRLADAGATVEELKLPKIFEAGVAAGRIILQVEAASAHANLLAQYGGRYGPRIRGLLDVGALIPAEQYVHAHRVRRRFRAEMSQLFAHCEVLLAPAVTTAALRGLASTGDDALNAPSSFSGLPALTIPSGLSEGGLPLAVQLIAAAFSEDRLLGAARWCEVTLGVELIPPLSVGRYVEPSIGVRPTRLRSP